MNHKPTIMKTTLPIAFFFIALAVASCTKSKTDDITSNNNTNTNTTTTNDPPLEGNWKMTLYIDSTSGVSETKDVSYLHNNIFMSTFPYPPVGDVIMRISFKDSTKTSGTINGSTIYNGCAINFTATPQKAFHYVSGLWTLALDPPWGIYFQTYIQTANSWSFPDSSTLRMQSPSKTLEFTRQ